MKPLNVFSRARLPEAQDYFAREGIALKGRGPWRDALCPFHNDSRPSLRIHLASGGWRCMACGAHGPDVLAFHQRRHRLGFVDAARALGVWEVRK